MQNFEVWLYLCRLGSSYHLKLNSTPEMVMHLEDLRASNLKKFMYPIKKNSYPLPHQYSRFADARRQDFELS